MGKGNRNRQNREMQVGVETVKATPKKKKVRYHKPLSDRAKSIIECAVALVLVLAIVAGALISAGTFKRNNILVHSKTGEYDLNQQMATYIVWDSLYYTGYYMWQYYQDSIQSSTGITNQSDYCLAYAMSGVQDTLLTSIEGNADSLKAYVAVCDAAAGLGISLSEEEIETAEEEAIEALDSMASSMNYSAKRFLKRFIGCNVKMKDVKAVARLQKLYSKVMESEEAKLKDSITDSILQTYRDENPESFYSTDYLSYTVKDGEDELKAALLAATSANEFKTILAKNEFENGESDFKTIFNKYTVRADATSLEAALMNKTTADELTEAITAAKTAEEGETPMLTDTDAIAEYTKDQDGLAKDVSDWMFAEGRKQFETEMIEVKNSETEEVETLYVVVLATAPADNKVNALVKRYDIQSGETYGEDSAFKANMLNTLLVKLELLEEEESMTLYDDVEATSDVGKMITDLETAMTKAIPSTKTEMYTADPEEGSYQAWMFQKDSLTAPEDAVAGKVKEISKTEGEGDSQTTTVTVYCIEAAMKFDTDPLVDGGYVEFSTTDHATDAAAFLATLEGLTGDDLAAKFSENSSATVSESIAGDDLDENLKAWLMSSDRKADDYSVIESDEKTFVAFFNSSVPTWEYSAENGYINETLTEWMDGLKADAIYELDGMKWIKDKNPMETTEETEAAA